MSTYSIYKAVDTALDTVTDNYYHLMPEFLENEEPEKYVVYTVQQAPIQYASGKASADRYFVAISVFTVGVDEDYRQSIIQAMEAANATYQGGRDVSGDTDYPYRQQYAMDFLIDCDRGGI